MSNEQIAQEMRKIVKRFKVLEYSIDGKDGAVVLTDLPTGERTVFDTELQAELFIVNFMTNRLIPWVNFDESYLIIIPVYEPNMNYEHLG